MDIYKIVSTSEHTIPALVARVSAGEPMQVSPAIDRIDVNALIGGINSDAVILVRVKSDSESMTPEIHPNDWLLIDRVKRPEPNEIVLAEFRGGYTLKRHATSHNGKAGLYLVPANELYETREINEADGFAIVGVVKWILRPL